MTQSPLIIYLSKNKCVIEGVKIGGVSERERIFDLRVKVTVFGVNF